MADSYLTRTPSGAGSRVKWTYSVWLKRSKLGHQPIWAATTDSNNYDEFYFNSTDKIQFSTVTSGTQKAIRTTRQFRDTSAWYHIVLVYDTGNSTDTDHAQLWINGVRETSFEDTTLLASGANNVQSNWNNNIEMKIGRVTTNTAAYFEGYMSHAAFVNDAVVAPTTFGETDSTSGIWKFKSPSGVTWGTNGFHLKFENSGNLGLDSSGGGNNFTTNGSLKQSLNTPSNVYATFSNLIVPWASSTVWSNGNISVTNSSGTEGTTMTSIGVKTGKWYCEIKQGNADDVYIGVGADKFITDNLLNGYSGATHNATTGLLVKHSNGTRYVNGSSSSSIFASTGSGDVTGIALDLDAATRTVTFYKNGVADGAGAQNLPTNMQTGFLFPLGMILDNSILHLNTGDGFFGTTAITSAGSNGNGSLFEYDVPSNHYALNTKNLNTYG